MNYVLHKGQLSLGKLYLLHDMGVLYICKVCVCVYIYIPTYTERERERYHEIPIYTNRQILNPVRPLDHVLPWFKILK